MCVETCSFKEFNKLNLKPQIISELKIALETILNKTVSNATNQSKAFANNGVLVNVCGHFEHSIS